MPNRLAREKSPYLQQHAHNPVEWMPWGEEAFARARSEDKPLLVSIGYSTCHWCHVMERESFEDAATAELMNRHLVCVKVDREERPDVDRVYMNAVSALSGQGGWPLNAFLTPEGKPFYGGTYFPPKPAYGRPAWAQLVQAIGLAWKDAAQRPRMLQDAEALTAALRRMEEGGEPAAALDAEPLEEALRALRRSFDPEQGGFAQAPKFPMPVFQHLLLRLGERSAAAGRPAEAAEARSMALHSLRQMARGGICDQLGGGFARYSTDEAWKLPHFEKMLYDNALLALNYAEAWARSGEPALAQTLRGVLAYLLRDLRAPGGGFYSAEDADSAAAPGGEKREGAFYVWSKAEIEAALGPDAELFCSAYGVEKDGNLREDPHGEFAGLNVLLDRRDSLGALAGSAGRSAEEQASILEECRRKLFAIRARRPRPSRDEKLLSSWNGLAIAALARAGALLGEQAWLQAAREAAEFFLGEMWEPERGLLWRRWAGGERAVEGQAEDYAFLAWGLLELHQAGLEERWLQAAQALLKAARPRFYDEGQGLYFPGGRVGDPRLPARLKESYDNVEPAAASVFAELQLRMWNLTGEAAWREDAERTLRAHMQAMRRNPRAAAFMLAALARALQPPQHALLLGRAQDPRSQALLKELRRGFRPWLDLRALDPDSERTSWPSHARALPAEAKGPALVLCRDFACRLPIADASQLAQALEAEGGGLA